MSKIVRYLPHKKKFCLALLLLLLPKICQGTPDNVLTSAPDFIQISSLLAQLYPNA